MVEHGADVNAAGGEDSEAPLDIAVRDNDVPLEAVSQLISPTNITSPYSKLPSVLCQVKKRGRRYVETLLEGRGAQCNMCDILEAVSDLNNDDAENRGYILQRLSAPYCITNVGFDFTHYGSGIVIVNEDAFYLKQ